MTRLVAMMRCERGAAAAEMAVVTPFLVLILAGLAETGYYFYAQHRLVEGVRDAARYAARQEFTNYASCPTGATPTDISGTAVATNAQLVARKGSLDTTRADRLWGWSQTGANAPVFSVTYECFTTRTGSSGTAENMEGIYENVVGGAPVVTVDAQLAHNGVFAAIGFDIATQLNAQSSASVAGL